MQHALSKNQEGQSARGLKRQKAKGQEAQSEKGPAKGKSQRAFPEKEPKGQSKGAKGQRPKTQRAERAQRAQRAQRPRTEGAKGHRVKGSKGQKGQRSKGSKGQRSKGDLAKGTKGTGAEGPKGEDKALTLWRPKFETAPLRVWRFHERIQRWMTIETHSRMKESNTDREFDNWNGRWKASLLLKASFWSCSIVHFKISQQDQNLRNILKMLSWVAIALQSAPEPSEWAPESCTCTVFRDVFSKRFQQHLEAKRMIFRDETAKMSSRKAFKQWKESIFEDLPCANGGNLSPEHPFYLHGWAFKLLILPFWSVISPFQECQHWKFSPVQEKPERFWILNRRETSGFRSVSGTQPSQKSTEKHHGSIVNGIPRPLNTSQSLEMHQWCWKRAPNAAQMLLTTSEWPPESSRICRPHLDHHECILFSVHAQWVDLNVYHACWGAWVSQTTENAAANWWQVLFADEPCSKEWPFSSCLAIVSMVHWSPCILKQSLTYGKRKASDDGMQVAISEVLHERSIATLSALLSIIVKDTLFSEPTTWGEDWFWDFFPFPTLGPCNWCLKAAILAICIHLQFPRGKRQSNHRSPRKCCLTTPWTRKMVKKPPPKKGGPETRQPLKFIYLSLD